MIYIMRGLPGSGKTSWVKNNPMTVPNCSVVSADDYHMKDGVYQFDPKRTGEAHNDCFHRYLSACNTATPSIVVDNTNTTLVELAPYVRVAEALKIDYVILYMPCDPIVAYSRNVHKVPIGTILKMNASLLTEIVPPHWRMEIPPSRIPFHFHE